MRRSPAAVAAAMAVAAVGAVGAAWLGGMREARAEQPGESGGGALPWSVEARGELALAPGAVAATEVVLRGNGRYRVSPSGMRLDLTTSGPGISVRQRRYVRADAGAAEGNGGEGGGDGGERAARGERREAVFSIPVRGEAVGSYDLEVRARFWVCTPRSCRPVDERRRIAVTVSEPVPVAPAAGAGAAGAEGGAAGAAGPAAGEPARKPGGATSGKTSRPVKGKPAKPFR